MRTLFLTIYLLATGAGLGVCAAVLIDLVRFPPVGWRADDHMTTFVLAGMVFATTFVVMLGSRDDRR